MVSDKDIQQALQTAFTERRGASSRTRERVNIPTKPVPSHVSLERRAAERRKPVALRRHERATGKRYGRGTKGLVLRSVGQDLMTKRLSTGGDAARKYLTDKASSSIGATIKRVGKAASKASTGIGLIQTAAELGAATIEFTKLKHQKKQAELGTRMIQSGMRSAKLKKSLGKNREGVPDIKVN